MADVITTIGTRADESIDISSVSGDGPEYVVSLSSATANTDNGDALEDEGGSNIYLIISGAGSSTLTVLDSTGIGSAPLYFPAQTAVTKRYYSTIAAWTTGLDDDDLYDDQDHAIGHCMADSTFTDDVNVNNQGRYVDSGSLSKSTLTVPAGQRHDGTHGTGARFVLGSNTVNFIKFKAQFVDREFSWMEVDLNSKSHYGAVVAQQNATNPVILHHLLVHNCDDAVQDLVRANGSAAFIIHNSAVYNFRMDSNKDNGGIQSANSDNYPFECYNVTVCSIFQEGVGSAVGVGGLRDHSNYSVKNTISVDVSDGCFEPTMTSGDFSHNIAGDDSADDFDDSFGEVDGSDLFVSVMEGSEEFELKSGTNTAVGEGEDLSSLSYTDIEIDLYGQTRSGDWDIGCHQRDVVSATFVPYPYPRGLSGGAAELSGGLS